VLAPTSSASVAEFVIGVVKTLDFGWADKGEIFRPEENDEPFSGFTMIVRGNMSEFFSMIGGYDSFKFEVREFVTYGWHLYKI